jgi:exonuclease VII small subunit
MGERMRKESLQQEFEATCFMYEMIESALKQAVNKYNAGMSLTHTQKQILAKAIWRN